MYRSSAIFVLLLATWGQLALAKPSFRVAWKMSSTTIWPPVVIEGRVVLKNGDTLSAYHLKDGRRVWRKRLDGLRYGAGAMAAGSNYIYLLGNNMLIVVDPKDGSTFKTKPVKNPNSVMSDSDSVYVTGSQGISRFDSSVSRLIGSVKGFKGELRGVDENYVALYSHKSDTTSNASPRRLRVIDLTKKEKTYEFKLLPTGWHRVIKVKKGRIVFIDYSQRKRDGSNAKKLYYTEADYVLSKKIKDKSLARRYPVIYASAASDTFWVATDRSNIVFLANHGEPGNLSSLVAYDPAHDKLLWNRSGKVLSSGLLLHQGLLWTTIVDREGASHAVAYSPDDGNIEYKIPIDSKGIGRPKAAGDRILIRTQRSIFCLTAMERSTKSSPIVDKNPPSRKMKRPFKVKSGWRLYRDKVAMYLIQTPKSWTFQRAGLRKMGGVRMSIPFTKQIMIEGRMTYLGSVHILTYEAAGRDVDGLWQSVYSQRRRLNPTLHVIRVHRVHRVGGSRYKGIRAVYTFTNRAGYSIQLRSLCVVANNIAYELRGWASSINPQSTWREIEQIFRNFRPHRF